MRPPIIVLALLGSATAMLSACQKTADKPLPAGNEAVAPANETSAPAAAPVAAKPVKVESKDEYLDFSYGWPGEATVIPALDQWLRGNMESHRARMTTMARADAKAAKTNGYPFRPYSYDETWSVTANTPTLLVLHAQGGEYTGGAHGNPFVATLIWDKAKGERLATAALLDVPALARVAKARFCKELDRQRAEKRGEPVDPNAAGPIPEFNQCVPLEKQDIVPLSRNGRTIDQLRIVILPYEAGPYAEGSYTIDLPMDAAMSSVVKPAWKGAFGAQ
ncbi:MAG: DUF4163 domain-containing protein [Sphingobium sp.]|nr:DUF4163 domain-containing protein [Sphingobium sp.]